MEFGGPEVLKVYDVPEQHAGPGEVRIAVRAAAVNPTDTYTRNGARAEMLKAFPPPYVPGMDVAGVVDEVGDAVTSVRVGDSVMAIVGPSGSHGGYSESIVLPAGSVTHTQHGVGFAEACTLPMNGLTARLSLDQLSLSPGKVLAVTGAAGAYGGYVVQLAKADGLRVIADASEKDEELVRSLGADIIVRRGPDVAARIREHAPQGVDGLADGSVQNDEIVAAVKDGGAIATVRGWKSDIERGITLHETWVRDYAQAWDKLDILRQQAEKGQLSLRVAQTFSPENASTAHELLQAGGTRGRFVIEF
jgi:NADPH:quinone reductase-like Zn-dependent oxidoreductase